VESIISQYTTTVRPMHLQFVEPSKRYADVIIPEGGHNEVALDLITGKIRSILARSLEEGDSAAVVALDSGGDAIN
jgi:uridine kinase